MRRNKLTCQASVIHLVPVLASLDVNYLHFKNFELRLALQLNRVARSSILVDIRPWWPWNLSFPSVQCCLLELQTAQRSTELVSTVSKPDGTKGSTKPTLAEAHHNSRKKLVRCFADMSLHKAAQKRKQPKFPAPKCVASDLVEC